MTILPSIQDGMERARRGELSLYWQRDIEREYRSKEPTATEQQAYADLQKLLRTVPQWSDEAELCAGMEELGGQVMFCRFFREHNSMVQLVRDCNGAFDVSYVLDADITPAERKAAAQEVQQLLSEQMRAWGVVPIRHPILEQMKYPSLELAASFLLQVLSEPESITG